MAIMGLTLASCAKKTHHPTTVKEDPVAKQDPEKSQEEPETNIINKVKDPVYMQIPGISYLCTYQEFYLDEPVGEPQQMALALLEGKITFYLGNEDLTDFQQLNLFESNEIVITELDLTQDHNKRYFKAKRKIQITEHRKYDFRFKFSRRRNAGRLEINGKQAFKANNCIDLTSDMTL